MEAKVKYESEKNKALDNQRQLALVTQQVQRQDDEFVAYRAEFSNLRQQLTRTNKEFEVFVFIELNKSAD